MTTPTRVRALLVALMLLMTTAAGLANAKPDKNRIDSISPAAAERGALVTITGNGFGAKNLQITVGGVEAELVSATGVRASFQVPATAPIGATTVESRNPGGQVGSIAFEVLGPPSPTFDGNVSPTLVVGGAVTQTIGPDGGTVEAGGATLDVPPGALPAPTAITMTPLSGIGDSPLSAIVGGVKLQPDGLRFVTPATLTIPLPVNVPAASLVGFGFAGAGSDFHLVPADVADGLATVLVSHFSGAGFVAPTPAELQQILQYQPTPGQATAEQAIVAAENDPTLSEVQLRAAIAAALEAWGRHSVSPGLQISASSTTGTIEFFELAIGEWLAWLSFVQHYGLGDADLSGWVDHSSRQALLASKAQAGRHLDACTGSGNILVPFGAVLRLATTLALFDPQIEENGTLPQVEDLAFSAMHVVIDAIRRPLTFVLGQPNRFEVDAHVDFWNGPDSTSIPLTFRLFDVTQGAPIAVDADSVTDGEWRTTVAFSQRGLRVLDLLVEILTPSPDPFVLAVAARRNLGVLVHDRVELMGDGPGEATFVDAPAPLAPGETVDLRVRLAGEGVGGVSIAMSVSGAGTLSSSTVTTNTTGEAFLTYTAPGACASDTIRATLTDATGTTVDALGVVTAIPVTAVSISPTSATLSRGATRQFTAGVTGGCSGTVQWSATGGTITQSGLFTAGTASGSFSVTAISLEAPSQSATAAVSIVSGAVKDVSRGMATSNTPNCSDADESPTGATTFLGGASCPDGDQTGDGAMLFAETIVGGRLTSVVGTSVSNAAQTAGADEGYSATGYAEYTLTFTVSSTTILTIAASVAGNGAQLFFLGGPGVFIHDPDGGPVNQTVTLGEGTYNLAIAASAIATRPGTSGTASWDLSLTFR